VSRRRRAALLLGMALVLGALAASDVARRESALRGELAPLVDVIVARGPLEAGERLRAGDLARRAVPERFAPVLQAAVETLPERGLFMCHPGHVDETLRARDPMQGVREVEYAVLASADFGASLARAGVEIMGGKG